MSLSPSSSEFLLIYFFFTKLRCTQCYLFQIYHFFRLLLSLAFLSRLIFHFSSDTKDTHCVLLSCCACGGYIHFRFSCLLLNYLLWISCYNYLLCRFCKFSNLARVSLFLTLLRTTQFSYGDARRYEQGSIAIVNSSSIHFNCWTTISFTILRPPIGLWIHTEVLKFSLQVIEFNFQINELNSRDPPLQHLLCALTFRFLSIDQNSWCKWSVGVQCCYVFHNKSWLCAHNHNAKFNT